MLLIQLQKVLIHNQYVCIAINRSFAEGSGECLEVLFGGPAERIPDKYSNRRIAFLYPDKNGNQVIELEDYRS